MTRWTAFVDSLALSLIASPVMACGMNKKCNPPAKHVCYQTPFGKWCVR